MWFGSLWRILREEPWDLIYALIKPLWLLCSEGEPRRRRGVRLGLIALIQVRMVVAWTTVVAVVNGSGSVPV